MINSAAEVDTMIKRWTAEGISKVDLCIRAAYACMGWPYVWGGAGQYCTPSNRETFANRSSCPEDESKVIVKLCQVLNGKRSSCEGCKWYKGGKCRFFDCRGFTRWILALVGVLIKGAGSNSQYRTDANWTEKGTIDKMPDVFCCVFMYNKKTGKYGHTGLYVGGGKIVHCSGEVKEDTLENKNWTHYAIPKGMGGNVPVSKPTLRIGSTGEYVVECQNDLIKLGYDVGKTGADGKYGKKTAEAVKAFQGKNGLKQDGVCGKDTWAALDAAVGPQPPVTDLYTVIIPHLTLEQAEELQKQYPDAEKRREG